jgi:hypothetical protein
MANAPAPSTPPPSKGPVYAWWLVLALVGLDYFSTLAYLPSIAVEGNHGDRLQAPLAALGVVVLTLLGALPVYLYVVGRSPHGQGATGLLERLVHGWSGKVFILVLLGFVATDFVVTRTLSVADASTHLIHNNYWKDHVEWITNNKEQVRGWFPGFLRGGFFDFWNEQLVVTIVLSILFFGFYAFVVRGFKRPFMILAAVVVALYLAVNAVVIGAGITYLLHHPERFQGWLDRFTATEPGEHTFSVVGWVALLAVVNIPAMVLGLSGFELSMTSAPLVRGRPDDDPARPRGRIRRARLLLVVSALIMSVFMVGAVECVAQFVPDRELKGTAEGGQDWNGPAMHRSLAYLAHGGELDMQYVPFSRAAAGVENWTTSTADTWSLMARIPALGAGPAPSVLNLTEAIRPRVTAPPPAPATEICPVFGPLFGTLYDLSTVLILCLAGASVTIGMRDVVPLYLAKFGMQLEWARKVGVTLHLFNVIILLVTLVFRASVSHQQWAYAASVLVLLTSAGLAALLDVRHRLKGSIWRWPAMLPFFLICLVFLILVALTLVQSRSGLYIPMLFVAAIVGTAFASRWVRSTELRFEGFDFTDQHTQKRWEEICQLEFQILVPHHPGGLTLAEKDHEIRARHRLGPDVPIIFIEAELGDPSEFCPVPLMTIEMRDGREVIRVAHCASISHVIAAIGLEFRHVGRPPEIHFAWSDQSPVAANLGFLLFGEGNIPWMVHALIRKAEPDPARRPRVVIG